MEDEFNQEEDHDDVAFFVLFPSVCFWRPVCRCGPVGAADAAAASAAGGTGRFLVRAFALRIADGDGLAGALRPVVTPGEDMRVERLMLALRTDAGLPKAELERLAAPQAVSRLRSEGALTEIPGERIRIPEDHFFVSDEIVRELLP